MGKTVHILLVEDDAIDLLAIQRAFQKERIANPIVVARDGIEGLEALRGTGGKPPITKPYVILLDWNMPRMNGLEFLKELRRDPEHGDAIVFVLTTSKADDDRMAAYGEHVAGYVLKENVGHTFMSLVQFLDSYWRLVELP